MFPPTQVATFQDEKLSSPGSKVKPIPPSLPMVNCQTAEINVLQPLWRPEMFWPLWEL